MTERLHGPGLPPTVLNELCFSDREVPGPLPVGAERLAPAAFEVENYIMHPA
jgi:hypothetical protein